MNYGMKQSYRSQKRQSSVLTTPCKLGGDVTVFVYGDQVTMGVSLRIVRTSGLH